MVRRTLKYSIRSNAVLPTGSSPQVRTLRPPPRQDRFARRIVQDVSCPDAHRRRPALQTPSHEPCPPALQAPAPLGGLVLRNAFAPLQPERELPLCPAEVDHLNAVDAIVHRNDNVAREDAGVGVVILCFVVYESDATDKYSLDDKSTLTLLQAQSQLPSFTLVHGNVDVLGHGGASHALQLCRLRRMSHALLLCRLRRRLGGLVLRNAFAPLQPERELPLCPAEVDHLNAVDAIVHRNDNVAREDAGVGVVILCFVVYESDATDKYSLDDKSTLTLLQAQSQLPSFTLVHGNVDVLGHGGASHALQLCRLRRMSHA
eukprot:CAMPEP_0117501022 /NCGR_PEP_ID=MMETSP0784-20121206/23080_1 /TAXON_ID=39447 /ORGANISM="" /LENGTH=316 /DNA_ID=CAMNT_0005296255 /DNA_START=134 /DNA_END=1082 /DNA_ORIENTATION=+